MYLNKGQVLCVSPMLSRTGNVGFKLRVLSKDGQTTYESDYVPFYSCEFVGCTCVGRITRFYKQSTIHVDLMLFYDHSALLISK